MESLSASLALCKGDTPFTDEFRSQKASNAKLWCSLCCQPEQAVGWMSLIARFMGPTWGPSGVGPRWAPCWSHEPCYLGCIVMYVENREIFADIFLWFPGWSLQISDACCLICLKGTGIYMWETYPVMLYALQTFWNIRNGYRRNKLQWNSNRIIKNFSFRKCIS